jgi:hypothetical protein
MVTFGSAISIPVGFPAASRSIDPPSGFGVSLVSDGAKRSGVQQRTIVEVQDEDGSVWRNCVDLVERRQAHSGELLVGEAADHAYPLRSRRACDLRLQHSHRIGQRANSVPPQLHIVVEPTTDHMRVAVDQARNHAAAGEVDFLGSARGERQHILIATDCKDMRTSDRDGPCFRVRAVVRRNAPVEQNEIGRRGHGSLLNQLACLQSEQRVCLGIARRPARSLMAAASHSRQRLSMRHTVSRPSLRRRPSARQRNRAGRR